jgi:hypothetical protein
MSKKTSPSKSAKKSTTTKKVDLKVVRGTAKSSKAALSTPKKQAAKKVGLLRRFWAFLTKPLGR